jgi:hypothetical protein
MTGIHHHTQLFPLRWVLANLFAQAGLARTTRPIFFLLRWSLADFFLLRLAWNHNSPNFSLLKMIVHTAVASYWFGWGSCELFVVTGLETCTSWSQPSKYLGLYRHEALALSSVFNFLRAHHIIFHSGCTILHSCQQCTKISVLSILASTYLLFVCFVFIITVLLDSHYDFNLHFPND